MIAKLISSNKILVRGLYIFIAGIIFNELLLMVQGIAAIDYLPIRFINELLLVAAGTMLAGTILIFSGSRKNQLTR